MMELFPEMDKVDVFQWTVRSYTENYFDLIHFLYSFDRE